MPNWCDNVLTVEGPPEDVEKFIQDGQGKGEDEGLVLSLNSLYPLPVELSETTSPSRIVEKVSCKSAMDRQINISYALKGKRVPDKYRHTPFQDMDFKRDGITAQTAESLQSKYGTDNWYDWSVANWGTKWDLCDPVIVRRDQDLVAYQFCTAWAPPITAIENILKDYPNLSFELEYEEPGMCFKGIARSCYNQSTGVREMDDEPLPWPDEDDEQGWS